MKLTLLALMIALGMSAHAYAEQSVYATGKLANGLTYHLFKVPSAGKRLVTRLNVGVGAADENAGEEGIAHITEHMVFQSSPQNPQGLSNRLNKDGWQMGRHYNAHTTYDYTRYMLTPPHGVRQLDEALLVYRDILRPKQFSREDWAKEQQVVLSEWQQQQNVQSRLSRQQHELMYKGARQGRYAPIGRLEAIKNADMKTAADFHNRWYAANNAVLVVMGNISIDDTVALIQKSFGNMQPMALAARNTDEYEPVLQNGWHIGQVSDKDNAEGKLAMVFRFKKQPTQAYQEQSYQKLLDNFAAYMINQRIKQSGEDVVLKMDSLGRNTGALVFGSDVAPNQHREVLEVLRNLRQDILNKPVSNEELAAYRKVLHGNMLPQNGAIPDNLNQIVNIADETVLQGLPLPDAEIQTIDRSQLYRINAKVVNERIASWLNAPDKMIQVQASAAEKIQLPPLEKLNTATKKSETHQSLSEPNFAEAQGGSIVAERKDDKLNIHYLTLSNGDTAVIMKLPMAGKSLYFKALSNVGYLNQPDEAWKNHLLAEMVARSEPKGMSNASFKQWQQKERIDKYGFRMDGYHQITDAQALNSALQPLLQLYRSYQTDADFSEWQQAVSREESRFKVSQHSKSGQQRQLSENMRYGRNILMPSESRAYAGLNQQNLARQWQQLALSPTTYYIVSNLPVEDVKPMVAKYLADIPRQPTPTHYPQGKGASFRQAEINDTEGAEIQAVSWQNSKLEPEQYEQIKLLNNLLNARLKEELRNKQQSAYGVAFRAEPDISRQAVESTLVFNSPAAQAQANWQTAQQVLRDFPDSIGYFEARNLRKLYIEQENLRRRKPELWLERLVSSHQNYGDARYLNNIMDVPDSFSRGNLRKTAQLMWSGEHEQVLIMLPRK